MLLMDSVWTEARITWRIIQETLGGLRRTGWMNLVIIITMASILSIFGTLSAFVLETQLFVQNIGSTLKISVYLRDTADVSEMQARIHQLPAVQAIDVVTKESAWESMKKDLPVSSMITNNPLPNTLHIQVKSQDDIIPTVETLHKLRGVEAVNYAKSVLMRLQSISRATSLAGLAVTMFLGTLTFFIISNTIHLLIQARGREIEIMRMMGVGNWYIRLPFLIQGGLYGLAGALIAYIPLGVVEQYMAQVFSYFQFSSNGYSLGMVLTIMLLIGVLVGAGAATSATHRYLKI